MIKITTIIAVSCLFLLSPVILAGEKSSDHSQLFGEACAAFSEAGKLESSDPDQARQLYQKAVMRYEKLIALGVENGKLYYNLGNAYFRLGKTGKAILEYKRALLFMPYDQNLQHNLSRARAMREDRFKQTEETRILKTLLFWHYDISTSTRQIIFGTFFIAFWLGLSLRLILTGKNFPPKWVLYVTGLAWACLLGSLIAQPLELQSNNQGVITATETSARKGDGENYQPSFTQPLHNGTEFMLIEKRPDWYEIRLEDGRTCWIKASAAELVRP